MHCCHPSHAPGYYRDHADRAGEACRHGAAVSVDALCKVGHAAGGVRLGECLCMRTCMCTVKAGSSGTVRGMLEAARGALALQMSFVVSTLLGMLVWSAPGWACLSNCCSHLACGMIQPGRDLCVSPCQPPCVMLRVKCFDMGCPVMVGLC